MIQEARTSLASAAREIQEADRLLTPAQVGRMVGFSASFIRLEIHAGAIKASRAGRGRLKRWKIAEPEAQRYRQQMMGEREAR